MYVFYSLLYGFVVIDVSWVHFMKISIQKVTVYCTVLCKRISTTCHVLTTNFNVSKREYWKRPTQDSVNSCEEEGK